MEPASPAKETQAEAPPAAPGGPRARAPRVVLKPRKALPFFARHPWVFSGGIARVEGAPAAGDLVPVVSHEGRFLGKGFFHPTSQIAVRLCRFGEAAAADEAWLREEISRAVRLRTQLLRLPEKTQMYRLVHAEADGLPGLTVDRYGDFLAVQCQSAGMDRLRDAWIKVLAEALAPRGIYERGDTWGREMEGLPARRGALFGEEPPPDLLLEEHGVRFHVNVREGHKTGFYLDQRENRRIFAAHMEGKEVLDAFSYTGGFAVAALKAGAARAVLVDTSERSLELARKNGEANGAADRLELVKDDAFEVLRRFKAGGRRFGGVVLDPPKFGRSDASLPKAMKAHRETSRAALDLLAPDGLLLSCSCNQSIGFDALAEVLKQAALEARRDLQILAELSAGPDHPQSIFCAETAYLSAILARG